MQIQDWTEVTALINERQAKSHGYFPSLALAKAANITGWYNSPPNYVPIKVLVTENRQIYKLTEIQEGSLT